MLNTYCWYSCVETWREITWESMPLLPACISELSEKMQELGGCGSKCWFFLETLGGDCGLDLWPDGHSRPPSFSWTKKPELQALRMRVEVTEGKRRKGGEREEVWVKGVERQHLLGYWGYEKWWSPHLWLSPINIDQRANTWLWFRKFQFRNSFFFVIFHYVLL